MVVCSFTGKRDWTSPPPITMRIFSSKNLNSRIITAKIDTTWCFYSPTNYSPNFYFYSLKSTKTKQLDYLKRKLKEKAIRFCRLILIFLIIWCSPSRISDKSQTLRKRLIFSLSQFRKQLTWKKKYEKHVSWLLRLPSVPLTIVFYLRFRFNWIL